MKQYRPTIDELKLRYSRMLAQRRMLRLHREARPGLANRNPIPDNSEPWLPHKPRNVEECQWVAEQVRDNIDQWKQAYPKIFSSVG